MLPFLLGAGLMTGGLFGLVKGMSSLGESVEQGQREQYAKDFQKIISGLDRNSPDFAENLAVGMMADPRMADAGTSVFKQVMAQAQQMYEFQNVSAYQSAALAQDESQFQTSEGRQWAQFEKNFELNKQKHELETANLAAEMNARNQLGGLDAKQYEEVMGQGFTRTRQAFAPLSMAQAELQRGQDMAASGSSNLDLYAATLQLGKSLQPTSSVMEGEQKSTFNAALSKMDALAQNIKNLGDNESSDKMRQELLDTMHILDSTIAKQAGDEWKRTEGVYAGAPVPYDMNRIKASTGYNFNRVPQRINLLELKAKQAGVMNPTLYKTLPPGFKEQP